jgi:hypothetical protein
MWYHAIVLDMFRPLLDKATEKGSRWSPAEIFEASTRQLKRLILVYKTRHQSASYTIFWSSALLYVANSVLRDTSDPERRFYFLLCIHSLQDLYPSYPVLNGVVQGLLTIGVEKKGITVPEARQLYQDLRSKATKHMLQERVKGQLVIDLDLAVIDSNAARMDRLSAKFDEIVAFDDYTSGVV